MLGGGRVIREHPSQSIRSQRRLLSESSTESALGDAKRSHQKRFSCPTVGGANGHDLPQTQRSLSVSGTRAPSAGPSRTPLPFLGSAPVGSHSQETMDPFVRGSDFSGVGSFGRSAGGVRALRVRQSLRTSYDSRLAALEAAEEAQRLRLAAPYTNRLLRHASRDEASPGSEQDVGCLPESAARRRRREAHMSSAFVNPYNNSYYALFQSDAGDAEVRARAMGMPPGSAELSEEHDSNSVQLNSPSEGETPQRAGRKSFQSAEDAHRAAEYLARLPQWRQKELRSSRYLLSTLHPVAAVTYVKYQKVHDAMVAEDRAFARDRKAFLDRDRQPMHIKSQARARGI